MSNIIFLDGEFLAEQNAAIATNDRGLLLSDGLFETIRCDKGQPLNLSQHWQRLSHGCEILGIPLTISVKEAQLKVQRLLEKNALQKKAASLRLTLTRGSGARGIVPPNPAKPTILMQCFEILEKEKDTISVMITDIKINEQSPLRQFKSLTYTENIIARQQAIAAGYDDALLLNTKGHLVSASCANIFFIIDGKLVTPSLRSGALPGIMRKQVLERAKGLGIATLECPVEKPDIKTAQSAFITNSIIQATPIHKINEIELPLFDEKYRCLIYNA